MRRAVMLAAGLLPLAAPVSAQEDFRNLDRGRPLRTEDAYPLPLREWEVEAGLRGTLQEAGSGAGGTAELKTGVLRNLEMGIELDGTLAAAADGEATGVEGLGAHALYGLRRETWSWPGVGLRGAVGSPGLGDAGNDGWRTAFDLLLTRSFGRVRLHANAGREWNAEVDAPDAWRLGLAADYPIGLFSRAIMTDVHATLPDDGGRAEVWFEVGTRWQITNTTVLDLGIGTRLDELAEGRGVLEIGLGFSYAFGVPGLVTVPPYPDPRID